MRVFWTFLLVGLLCGAQVWSQDDGEVEDEDEDFPNEEPPPLEPMERPVYKAPVAKGTAYLAEAFESEDSMKNWIQSKATKDDTDESIAKYDGQWKIEEPKENPLQGDLGLVLKSKAKHHAISSKLTKPYEFKGEPFIIQYEVKFQNGQECGGAYVKLLSRDAKLDLKDFKEKSGYTIMFGPDKCGNDNKLHFIFRHKNPKTGEFEEKHAKKPSTDLGPFFTDKKTHLYTLVVHPDNTFEIFIDQDLVNSGSLLEDVEPPVNPPKEIDDPNDKKPADWDERPKIPDPDAQKPEDWDETLPEFIDDESAVKPDGWLDEESELIPDPDAEKPSDWDPDMDGEWEAPMINNPKCESVPGCGEWKRPQIKNPKYKGKWTAPMVENPNYKGKWKPQRIANPAYFEDLNPYKMTPIVAVGLELWSMSDDIMFDNFLITDDKVVADAYAADSWEQKHAQELMGGASGKSVVDAVMDATKERPWLWAVFIIVVVLPIVLVIAYCCMSGSKEGILSTLLKAADERKWLYAVYGAVLIAPVALLSIWLCPNSGLGVKADDIAKAKKSDEPTPDDEGEAEPEAEEEEDVGAGGDMPKDTKKKSSKSALDAEEENEAQEEEEGEAAGTPTRSSPRKRKNKARKD